MKSATTKTKTKVKRVVKSKGEDKLDLYSKYSKEYAATTTPALVTIGPAMYLSITGKGAPGSPVFTEAIGALYGVAFTVKMTRKFAGKRDYVVSKLEGRWPDFKNGAPVPDKEQWTWEMMIRTPDFVKEREIKEAVAVLEKRGKGAGANRVHLETIEEGLCVQALHVGPYEKEGEIICKMGTLAESKGFKLSGEHHEIYLSDPRRVAPEKLKTILRHPVEPMDA
jgi:hypothetical protein